MGDAPIALLFTHATIGVKEARALQGSKQGVKAMRLRGVLLYTAWAGALLFAVFVALTISARAEEPAAGGPAVTMVNRTFQPFELRVEVGQAVTWTNADTVPHTIIADDGSFATGYIIEGQSFSYPFERPGRYSYYCDIHQGMEGLIVVQATAAGKVYLPLVSGVEEATVQP